jgi:hypothetical protein
MRNGIKCAFPSDRTTHTDGGLTKREYTAIKMMAALISKGDHLQRDMLHMDAQIAIQATDAILNELAK